MTFLPLTETSSNQLGGCSDPVAAAAAEEDEAAAVSTPHSVMDLRLERTSLERKVSFTSRLSTRLGRRPPW